MASEIMEVAASIKPPVGSEFLHATSGDVVRYAARQGFSGRRVFAYLISEFIVEGYGSAEIVMSSDQAMVKVAALLDKNCSETSFMCADQREGSSRGSLLIWVRFSFVQQRK
jgi:hypothetical protein